MMKAKKEYSKPKVYKYGSVVELTRETAEDKLNRFKICTISYGKSNYCWVS